MKIIIALLAVHLLFSCRTNTQGSDPNHESSTATVAKADSTRPLLVFPEQVEPISKSEEVWEEELSEQEFYVLRRDGTERAFTGDLWDNKQKGTYVCAACGLPLFSSETKFKSGTGWPSFYEPIRPQYIVEDTDYKIGYARTEVSCARCGGHQGHVFNDGPKPTGLRYCINSVSLDFVPQQP